MILGLGFGVKFYEKPHGGSTMGTAAGAAWGAKRQMAC